MEQWIALAEKSGLKGLDLLGFVDKCKAAEEAKQKQINYIEDRAAEIELRKLELEKEAKSEAEANALKKLELERRAAAEAEENAMRKLELESKMKEEEHLHALELQKEKRGRALEEKS